MNKGARDYFSKPLERKEIRKVLAEALPSLRRIYREAFVLRDLAKLSTAAALANHNENQNNGCGQNRARTPAICIDNADVRDTVKIATA
jgi:FixJ family two-component response regulator